MGRPNLIMLHMVFSEFGKAVPGKTDQIPPSEKGKGMTYDQNKAVLRSVSDGSGSPGCSPGQNQSGGPGPRQEPPRNLNRHTTARLSPWPDADPWGFPCVGTGLLFHSTGPTILAAIRFLGSDRIVTWSIRRLCSFGRSFTSRFQNCHPTNIRWIAVK